MPSPPVIVYAALLIAGSMLSCWLATLDYRRSQTLGKQTSPSWPLEFPVYWLDYYLGPRFAKYLRLGQLLVLAPLMGIEAFDAVFRDGKPQGMLLVYLSGVLTLVIRTYIPKICRVDESGIRFEHLYAWEAIRRFTINERRLLFVAERRGAQPMLSHIEIPLNGLPPACRTQLEEQLAARVGQVAVAG